MYGTSQEISLERASVLDRCLARRYTGGAGFETLGCAQNLANPLRKARVRRGLRLGAAPPSLANTLAETEAQDPKQTLTWETLEALQAW